MKKTNKEKAFRYERKFVVEGMYNRELESMIKLHPAHFREIFHERIVNNIYFDTTQFKYYRENVDGNASRVKVRIRWYGDLFEQEEKPVLEYKIKSALMGRKESFKLAPFQLDQGFSMRAIKEMVQTSDIPEEIKVHFYHLQPVLLNRYSRKYYLSADQNYRITIDQGLEYYSIRPNNNFFISKFKDPPATIVELKYASDVDNGANELSTLFPFRMTKSSKYVNGVDRFFGSTI